MPTPTARLKARSQAERPNTRAESRDSPQPEEQYDINGPLQGRKFLEKHLLLCPAGEPPTHTSLATCLQQISEMAGVNKPVLNAIRSVAFLLEELEDTQINETVKDAFDSQMTEFGLDVKSLIENVKDNIDLHLKETAGRLTQLVDDMAAQPRPAQSVTYASVLSVPPPHANPRIAAKEGIKARQFLLEGLESTKFSHTDVFQLKTELNKSLENLGLTDGKIRSINKLRNGGALVEMDSEVATTWMLDQENRKKLCDKIGPSVVFRSRVHNLIAFNVPLGINPDDQKHRQEICEVNSLDAETIAAMRWVKPVHRRAPTQRTAHLILTFNSADAANRVITNGIYICNRRCHAERVRREPTRCLKCQGWNHFAKDCQENSEKCGNCTKNHRTSDCPTPLERCCVSCKTDDHASWSRECPTFKRKLSDFNDRNPENALQYIPTADPWTWTASVKPVAHPMAIPTNKQRYTREGSQPAKTNPNPIRRHDSYVPSGDSYVPNYNRAGNGSSGDSYVPSYGKTGKRVQDRDEGWGGRNKPPPKDLTEFRPLTKEYLKSINEENPSRPTNAPTPTPSS